MKTIYKIQNIGMIFFKIKRHKIIVNGFIIMINN